MIRYFCDCCGEEIADTNRIESDKGRLLGVLRSKLRPPGEPLQVEVTTALGSSWNGGHFCKYCVIDAVNTKDDRPQVDVVPRHKPQQAETRHMNLLLDLGRVINGEAPLNEFSEVEQLKAMLAAPASTSAAPPPSPTLKDTP